MSVALAAVVAIAFVVGTLAVVAWGIFELTPFAHHVERFHEPGRRQESPRLD